MIVKLQMRTPSLKPHPPAHRHLSAPMAFLCSTLKHHLHRHTPAFSAQTSTSATSLPRMSLIAALFTLKPPFPFPQSSHSAAQALLMPVVHPTTGRPQSGPSVAVSLGQPTTTSYLFRYCHRPHIRVHVCALFVYLMFTLALRSAVNPVTADCFVICLSSGLLCCVLDSSGVSVCIWVSSLGYVPVCWADICCCCSERPSTVIPSFVGFSYSSS